MNEKYDPNRKGNKNEYTKLLMLKSMFRLENTKMQTINNQK